MINLCLVPSLPSGEHDVKLKPESMNIVMFLDVL